MRKDTVIRIIDNRPGISFNEIVREIGLSNGVISYYLIKLMESKEIEKEDIKRGKYFLKKISKKDRIIITHLRQKTNNEIFKLFMKNLNYEKIFTQNEISKKINKSASTVSVSLKVLHKNNIIERVILNKSSKITSDIGYRILNRDLYEKLITKYNL